MYIPCRFFLFFFFNDTATTEIYTLSLHDALPIYRTLVISVGGGMGYFMLLSVWGVVWRCQKRLIAWTKASAQSGTPMPPEAATLARLSYLMARTNFWLSFPMLFFMAASSHFPFLSGH